MANKKRSAEATPTRPATDVRGSLKVAGSLSALVDLERRKPINRAWEKFRSFVNACVGDPDYRDQQSQPLLDFLVVARDSLTDGINEKWTLEDILQPIVVVVKARAAEARMKGLDKLNKQRRPSPKADAADKEIRRLWDAGKKENKDIPAIVAKKTNCSKKYARQRLKAIAEEKRK